MRKDALVVTLLLVLLSQAARAEDGPVYRKSLISFRNAVSARTLQPEEDLTYDPTYSLLLELAPTGWFGDVFYGQARLAIEREATNSDDTTYRGETQISDLALRVGASRFVTIPGAGIDLSATFDIVTPTSKVTRARTGILGLEPGVSLRRNFDVLGGISVGYGFQALKWFNRSTTAERETPLIATCSATFGCDSFTSMGNRNTSWRLINAFDASVAFTKWVSLGATVVLYTDTLYPSVSSDPATGTSANFVPQEPTDLRHLVLYELEVAFQPMDGVELAVGTSTFNPQLAPDSARYAPFINRYTALFIDLRVELGAFVTGITSRSHAD